jgi:hypothetical protein
MIRIPRTALLVVAALAVTPLLVEAHHGQAMYDEKEVTVTGVVKEFQYTNPHSWLLVDVTNKDGSVTTWGFEAEGPNTMIRNGIHKSDLNPGTKVTVTTHPMKNGQPAGMWLKAVRGDGVEFDPRLRPAAGAAAPPASGTTAPPR